MKKLIVTVAFVFFSFNSMSLTVMPMGDSITVGFAEVGGSYRYNLTQMLNDVDMVGDFYKVSGGLVFDGDHQGKGGYKIEQMIAEYGPAVAQYQPDYILLLAGTNNHWDGNINYESKYQSLVDMITSNSPNSKIIMASPPKFGYDREPETVYWTNEWVDDRNDNTFWAMRDAVAKVASVNPEVIWVDYYSHLDPSIHLVADAVHPNASGQLLLANLFYNELTRIPGDLDGDGDVDGTDIAGVFSGYTGPVFSYSLASDGDFDGDGDVDGVDVATAFSEFTGPLSAVQIPEPSTLLLIGISLLFLRPNRSLS